MDIESTKRKAHIAGMTYFLLFTAPFSLIYVPNKLIVRGDAAATASNILAHETMFRLAIVNEVLSSVAFIFLGMALFRLLSDVDRTLAWLMVILGGVVCAPITVIGAANEIAALAILRGGNYLTAFNKPQLDALAMTFVRLHGQGIVVSEIFWGLWLLPFGLLVIRSGFIPRIFGYLLLVNGFAYVVVSITTLLAPAYGAAIDRWALIAYTGELWIALWLLIKGVKTQRGPVLATA
jgi:hypothetical protein